MPLTARVSVIAKRFETLFKEDIVENELFFDPTVKAVYYGDQTKVPYLPSICIEPGIKRREWPPRPTLQTENTIEVTFLIYHAKVSDGSEAAKYATDRLGEAVEEYVNINHHILLDASGNPLVIHGSVVEHEPGYSYKEQSYFNASRVLWRGLSKTMLTVAG